MPIFEYVIFADSIYGKFFATAKSNAEVCEIVKHAKIKNIRVFARMENGKFSEI